MPVPVRGSSISSTEFEKNIGMITDNMDDEASVGTNNTDDTLSASAAQKKRREERDRRLQEIEKTFQTVVEESYSKEESIYHNVFRQDGAVHNEANIKEVETQIKGKQTVLGKVAKKLSLKKEEPTYPFQMQYPSGVSNFDDLPGFLPPDDFGKYGDHVKESGSGGGGLGGSKHGKRASTRGTVFAFDFLRRHRLLIVLVLMFCFGIAVAITIFDFGDAPPPLDIPRETWRNLEDLRDNLIRQGVNKTPLYHYDTAQFSAVKQLAEEVTLGKLTIPKTKGHTKPGAIGEVFAEISDDRDILERYALLTLYYSTTTSTEKWKKNDNWQSNDKSICGGWYNVECKDIGADYDPTGSKKVVSKIILKENGLVGTIPDELEHVSSLEELHLEGNKLEGEVPASLGNLRELKTLRLSFNNLTGRVPHEICNLKTNGLLDLVEVSCADLECSCCDCL